MPNTKYVWDQSEDITFPFTAPHDGIVELTIITSTALYSGARVKINDIIVAALGSSIEGLLMSTINSAFVAKGDVVYADINPQGGTVIGKFFWSES